MSFSLLNILGFVILAQLAFLSLFLLTHHKGKGEANKLLGLLFLLLVLNVLDGLLFFNGIYLSHPDYALLEESFTLLYGPIVLLYTRKIIYKDYNMKPLHLLHLIPFILTTIFFILNYHSLDTASQKAIIYKLQQFKGPMNYYYIIILTNIHILIYLLISKRAVNTYREILKHKFSSIEPVQFSWLSFMINSFLGLLFISLMTTVIASFIPAFAEILLTASVLFIFYFINRVLYKGLSEPHLFSGIRRGEIQQANQKYLGSGLSSEEQITIKTRLEKKMQDDKLFLDPSLTIDALASYINTTSKKLSEVINGSLKQNFYEYINSWRIAHAKRLMASDDDQLTILEILYQSGFNSKSSFNAFFKKSEGLTPTQYRKKIQQMGSDS